MTEQVECRICGAVVVNKQRHESWHSRFSAAETMAAAAMEAAEEAQMTADNAANVLYQNNIQA